MSDEMIAWIVEAGYSVEWGAREIRRAIDRLVMTPLAAHVYRLDKGGLKVTVRLADGTLEIKHRHAKMDIKPKGAGA
jgi:ATP-dependent Clp protease ATP-binding subunit ClpA